MKLNCKFISMLLLALFVFISPPHSHAKLASPPQELTLIFEDFSAFEISFKSSDWEKAQKSFDKIDATFKKMLPQLEKEIGGNIVEAYYDISSHLEKSVKQRDLDATSTFYIQLHKCIFTLINRYEYKTPPVIIIIDKYIDEAQEALEEKRYSRVASEMEEILYLFYFVEQYLDNKDAKRQELRAIKAKIEEIMMAAQNKKGKPAKIGIKSLKKMLSDLVLK